MKSEIRYCEDIGMFAFDRPIPTSCVHRTEYCDSHCFNDKLYRLYPAMHGKDIRNEAYWTQITGEQVFETLQRKRKQTKRVRFMTRGEALSDYSDFARVIDICTENPDTDFWLPTRAWRNPVMRLMIERELMGIENLYLLASLDPSNSADEYESLVLADWSTMFFGQDSVYPFYSVAGHEPSTPFKCPKTWGHVKGACAVCKNGCFMGRGRVDVWLSQH